MKDRISDTDNGPLAENDEDGEGRILSDYEFMQKLKNRDDIFIVDNNATLRVIEIITLIIGVITGIWLSTAKDKNPVTNFNNDFFKQRTAKLLREHKSHALYFPKDVFDNKEKKESKTAINIYVRGPMKIQDNPRVGINSIPGHVKSKNIKDDNKPILSSVKDSLIVKYINPKTVNFKNSELENAISNSSNITSNSLKGEIQQKDTNAFTHFEHNLSKNPFDTIALNRLGDLLVNKGLFDSAAEFYNRALAVNPNIAGTHNGLGNVHYYYSTLANNPYYITKKNIHDPVQYMKVQYDSAIIEYTNALSVDKSDVEALTNRGVIRDFQHDVNGAIRDFTQAIEIKPTYADAYNKRASIYKSLGKYKDAIDDYTSAIKLDSSSYKYNPTLRFANAYFGRGTVFYKMRNYHNAIKDYDSTLALLPNHSLALLNKAIALNDLKQYDSAISVYSKAISLLSPMEYDGAKMIGFINRGNVYKAQGKYDLAIADYTSALESKKLDAKACWRIAECYSLEQKKNEAVFWLKKSIANGFIDFKIWKEDKELTFISSTKEFNDMINAATQNSILNK